MLAFERAEAEPDPWRRAAWLSFAIGGGGHAPFRYRDHGNLATIGRMAAIVHLGRLRLSGLLAWWFWLAAHVFFLIGFRNRLVVLLNWAWAHWSYRRTARTVPGRDDAPDGRG